MHHCVNTYYWLYSGLKAVGRRGYERYVASTVKTYEQIANNLFLFFFFLFYFFLLQIIIILI